MMVVFFEVLVCDVQGAAVSCTCGRVWRSYSMSAGCEVWQVGRAQGVSYVQRRRAGRG